MLKGMEVIQKLKQFHVLRGRTSVMSLPILLHKDSMWTGLADDAMSSAHVCEQ